MNSERNVRQAQQNTSRQASTAALLAGWFIGPLAWAMHENVSYYAVFWVCGNGREWLLHVITGVALAAAVGALLLSWSSWRAARDAQERAAAEPASASRVRFLAIGGMLLSALSAFGVAMTGAMTIIIPPCAVAT